jgi:hypothetical protein
VPFATFERTSLANSIADRPQSQARRKILRVYSITFVARSYAIDFGNCHLSKSALCQSSTRDCSPCPTKPKCTPNMTFRKIPRDVQIVGDLRIEAWIDDIARGHEYDGVAVGRGVCS